jgi:hypothetical protein
MSDALLRADDVVATSPAKVSEEQRRWRLILGQPAEDLSGGGNGPPWLDQRDQMMDRCLALVYGCAGARPQNGSGRGPGGRGPSMPHLPDWLDALRNAFPKQAVEVVQRDAVKREGFEQLLLDPECVQHIEPNVQMVAKLVQLANLVPDQAKGLARALVKRVVDQIQMRMRDKLERALRGPPDPIRRVRQGPTSLLDWRRTVRANLKNYQGQLGTVVPERVYYRERCGESKKRTPWEIIILVDQSGSMGTSLVYASVSASVLASLQAVSTRLLLFDTNVVDVSDRLKDPVDILFGAPLGGGTDIARAIAHAKRLVNDPQHTLFALITDLYDGSPPGLLVSELGSLKERGATVVTLLGMTDQSVPMYNPEVAAELVRMDIPAFCATPDRFADLIGRVLRGETISAVAEERS